MTKKNYIFSLTILTLISLTILLLACGQKKSNQKNLQNKKSSNIDKSISVDTFSTIPPEIDGCSCYFSNNETEFKNNEYIYANDFAEIAFLKINGIMTKFIQTKFDNLSNGVTIAKYKSDKYEMTIEVKDNGQAGKESSIKTGTIKLTDKNQKSTERQFYGVCGC